LFGAAVVCGGFLMLVASAADEKPALPEHINPAGIPGSILLAAKMPDAAVKHFVELAGGEKANVVVVPATAEREKAVKQFEECEKALTAAKVATVELLRLGERQGNDKPVLEALAKATGVWLTGDD